MSASLSVTPPNAAPSLPMAIKALPDIEGAGESCSRRARQQLDLILLAIEALDLGGSEAILIVAKELELTGIIKNRVQLWRLRSSNPLRRNSQRRPLQPLEAKALIVIIGYIARRLTVVVRQLLLVEQQLRDKGQTLESNPRLNLYLERFRQHFRQRMNPRRAGVMAYDTDDKLNQLAISLLEQLLFCTGTAGEQRLWISLFDGEV
ncbi:MAG: DUF3038 domain-containing protein [Synechococcales cyanobacterium RM1_1_8]|nr:DUF3038 domain-containing protein [Synechococcales cyanobacterium RM1_1_8]